MWWSGTAFDLAFALEFRAILKLEIRLLFLCSIESVIRKALKGERSRVFGFCTKSKESKAVPDHRTP
ncbi:MAG: hypothetical protein CMJ78_23930 [Planctomycetaceae bacterium]|nr:hypothetical protein [Planctomycetaceae bacterium]